MGLNEVIQEILNSAQKEVAAIEKQAREESGAILSRAKAEVKEKEEIAAQDFARVKEALEKRMTSSANLESKKMIQDVKRNLLDQVYKDAEEKLQNLDAKNREVFMKSLAVSAKKEMDAIATIYCNKKDLKAAQSAFSGANIKETNILGGVILENKEKTVRIDLSFGQMLATVRDQKLKEISEQLFGKAK